MSCTLVSMGQTRALCSTTCESEAVQRIRAAAEAWQRAVQSGLQPPLRFPVGVPVECRLGEHDWADGKVVAHHHREATWPEGVCMPYQVLLDPAFHSGGHNAVWAPADIDECIRAALRFQLGDAVECCIGDGVWARGKVAAHFYREPTWPDGQYAPYQVQLEQVELFPEDFEGASPHSGVRLETGTGQLVWAPQDTDECIRARLV